MKVFSRTFISLIVGLGLCLGTKGCAIESWYYDHMGEVVVGKPVVVESISYDRYAYQQLDDETKQVYDQILDTVLKFEEKCTLVSLDTEKLIKAYEAMMADYGGLFWISGYQYNTYKSGEKIIGLEFVPKYTMTQEEKDEYQIQVDAIVEEWLAGISITDSDFDKAQYVFENLINRTEYVGDADNNQNILSVFLTQETVCQGYASAAWYLLNELQIPSTIISGEANGEPHAWNLVYLDSAYYFMDVTWGNSRYLDSNNTQEKRVNYGYMAMTTEEMALSHTVTSTFEIPECLSNGDNYYVHNGMYIDEWDIGNIGHLIERSWDSQEEECAMKFANSDLYNKAIEYFLEERHISDFCWGLKSISYLMDENTLVLTLQWK